MAKVKIPTNDEILAVLVKEFGVENIDVKDCFEIERMIEKLSDEMLISYDYDVIQNTGSSWQQIAVYSSDLGTLITDERVKRDKLANTCHGKSIILDGDAVGEFDDIDSFIGQVISWEIEARELLDVLKVAVSNSTSLGVILKNDEVLRDEIKRRAVDCVVGEVTEKLLAKKIANKIYKI